MAEWIRCEVMEEDSFVWKMHAQMLIYYDKKTGKEYSNNMLVKCL